MRRGAASWHTKVKCINYGIYLYKVSLICCNSALPTPHSSCDDISVVYVNPLRWLRALVHESNRHQTSGLRAERMMRGRQRWGTEIEFFDFSEISCGVFVCIQTLSLSEQRNQLFVVLSAAVFIAWEVCEILKVILTFLFFCCFSSHQR